MSVVVGGFRLFGCLSKNDSREGRCVSLLLGVFSVICPSTFESRGLLFCKGVCMLRYVVLGFASVYFGDIYEGFYGFHRFVPCSYEGRRYLRRR